MIASTNVESADLNPKHITPDAKSSAALRTFAIPELSAEILKALDNPADVWRCHRVARDWATMIKDTSALQARMFLKPSGVNTYYEARYRRQPFKVFQDRLQAAQLIRLVESTEDLETRKWSADAVAAEKSNGSQRIALKNMNLLFFAPIEQYYNYARCDFEDCVACSTDHNRDRHDTILAPLLQIDLRERLPERMLDMHITQPPTHRATSQVSYSELVWRCQYSNIFWKHAMELEDDEDEDYYEDGIKLRHLVEANKKLPIGAVDEYVVAIDDCQAFWDGGTERMRGIGEEGVRCKSLQHVKKRKRDSDEDGKDEHGADA